MVPQDSVAAAVACGEGAAAAQEGGGAVGGAVAMRAAEARAGPVVASGAVVMAVAEEKAVVATAARKAAVAMAAEPAAEGVTMAGQGTPARAAVEAKVAAIECNGGSGHGDAPRVGDGMSCVGQRGAV